MTDTAQATDKQMGYTALFGLLAMVGVGLMYLGEEFIEPSAGWGFAAALVFGTLLIVAIHVYD